MSGRNIELKGYNGGNPFRESQARTYGDEKLTKEFYPTGPFWSLFNPQHEILLGTRGSGKTAILKMMSYSCLKRIDDDRARAYVQEKSFIGFYVPMHLEFAVALQGIGGTPDDQQTRFCFAFNCAAAKSLVGELETLVNEQSASNTEQLTNEARLVDELVKIWTPLGSLDRPSLSAVRWAIDVLHTNHVTTSGAELVSQCGLFATTLFAPIISVLGRISEVFHFNYDHTTWFACIDEAEFLPTAFLRCINTFLRSEKKPLVVKMATLPFGHSTKDTSVAGVSIQPNGNDFNYRIVDLDCESSDFEQMCDQLTRTRLAKCGLRDTDLSLASFLGVEGKDDLVDYYRKELPSESDDLTIWKQIVAALSPKRQARYSTNERFKGTKHSDFKKFMPVFFCRRMKQEDVKGNRAVGWFAGARVIRKIADGNPRRFIQIMDALVEKARDAELIPKNQHRTVADYCYRCYLDSEGLPSYGPLVKMSLERLGKQLALRIHGSEMRNGGCNFRIDSSIVDDRNFTKMLELASAYSIVFPDKQTLCDTITTESEFRLSYALAVVFWLPMRKGDDFILRKSSGRLPFGRNDPAASMTRKEAEVLALELDFGESGHE